MTKRVRDERQCELFCLPEPLPVPVKAVRQTKRQPKEEPAAAPRPEMTAEEVVACLTPSVLENLVSTLPDDKLALVVIAATRDLKRRLARSGSQRRSRSAKGGVSDLERAVRQGADAFREAAPSDEW